MWNVFSNVRKDNLNGGAPKEGSIAWRSPTQFFYYVVERHVAVWHMVSVLQIFLHVVECHVAIVAHSAPPHEHKCYVEERHAPFCHMVLHCVKRKYRGGAPCGCRGTWRPTTNFMFLCDRGHASILARGVPPRGLLVVRWSVMWP